jgi:hypothetical protein
MMLRKLVNRIEAGSELLYAYEPGCTTSDSRTKSRSLMHIPHISAPVTHSVLIDMTLLNSSFDHTCCNGGMVG